MKRSSLILISTFVLLIAGMFVSNGLLKKEYDNFDKSDSYWTYGKINEQPFKYLKIDGGNLTNIAFEPARKSSVRVLKNWGGYEKGAVRTDVRNDTLYLHFPKTYRDVQDKVYMQYNTLVRIFSPELLAIEGEDTNIGLYKMKQTRFHFDLRGKSKLEVESYVHQLDSVDIHCRDSAEVVFEISPDSLGTKSNVSMPANGRVVKKIAAKDGTYGITTIEIAGPKIRSWEAMTIQSANVIATGASLVDLGHAQIGLLQLSLADTSGIILSGQGLKRYLAASAR